MISSKESVFLSVYIYISLTNVGCLRCTFCLQLFTHTNISVLLLLSTLISQFLLLSMSPISSSNTPGFHSFANISMPASLGSSSFSSFHCQLLSDHVPSIFFHSLQMITHTHTLVSSGNYASLISYANVPNMVKSRNTSIAASSTEDYFQYK